MSALSGTPDLNAKRSEWLLPVQIVPTAYGSDLTFDYLAELCGAATKLAIDTHAVRFASVPKVQIDARPH